MAPGDKKPKRGENLRDGEASGIDAQLPLAHAQPASSKELRQIITNVRAKGEARVNELSRAQQAIRETHDWVLSVSYHGLAELSRIASYNNGPAHRIQDISDVLKPEDYEQMVDFLHTKGIEEARNCLVYDSLYTVVEPVDKLRPELSKVLMKLAAPKLAIPHVEAGKFNTMSEAQLLRLARETEAWELSLTKLIRGVVADLRAGERAVSSYIEDMHEGQLKLKVEKAKVFKNWKSSDENGRLIILYGEVTELMKDGLRPDNKDESLDLVVANVDDEDDFEEDDTNLERTKFLDGWKMAKALVHYESFEDFEAHWNTLVAAVDALENASMA